MVIIMKNTVKKNLCTFIAVIVAASATIVFAGCSDNGAPQASTGSEGVASQTSDDASAVSQTKQPAKKRETIKIDDIAWNVDQGIVDGEKYVLLDYTNNSKYTVTDFEMTFKEKGSVTEEDKENFYNEIKDKFSMSDDDISELKQRDISMHAETEKIVEPGESAKNINCYYYSGIYYLKDINHFNLVEPDVATIKYINDNKIYTSYYDFSTKKYSEDENTEEAYYWTTSELGTKIHKPDVKVVKKSIDNEDSFGFEAYGLSLDQFNEYVDKCKQLGFTVDESSYEGYYSADDKDGYNVYLSYKEDDDYMTVTIDAPSE